MDGTQIHRKSRRCLHCGHGCARPDGKWFELPVAHSPVKGFLYVFGLFCTPACAWAYVEYGIPESLRSQAGDLLHAYLRLNLRQQLVRPAPPRWELLEYGGTMTIEEFRSIGGVKDWATPLAKRTMKQKHFIGPNQGKAFVIRHLRRLPGVRLLSASSA